MLDKNTSPSTCATTRCNTSETLDAFKDHDEDDGVAVEDDEADDAVEAVASPPPKKGRSASFAEPQRRPSRIRKDAAVDPSNLEGPEAPPCAGPGCPQPSQLCRQTSRNSNRPPSPHYPHIALSLSRSVSAPGAVYIEWEEGDPEDPMNWPRRKKWTLVIAVFLFTAITAIIGESVRCRSQCHLPRAHILFPSPHLQLSVSMLVKSK